MTATDIAAGRAPVQLGDAAAGVRDVLNPAARSGRRLIMRNPGGDALDAINAAVGAARAVATASHTRYPRKAYLYI